MALTYENLDQAARIAMVEEFMADRDTLDIPKSLTPAGAFAWKWSILYNALLTYDADWLASQILNGGHGGIWYQPHRPHRGIQQIAEGAFNRYYIRAVCKLAIAAGEPTVLIYRGARRMVPRESSLALEGTTMNPVTVLAGLRAGWTVDGLPGGYNSAITVKRVAVDWMNVYFAPEETMGYIDCTLDWLGFWIGTSEDLYYNNPGDGILLPGLEGVPNLWARVNTSAAIARGLAVGTTTIVLAAKNWAAPPGSTISLRVTYRGAEQSIDNIVLQDYGPGQNLRPLPQIAAITFNAATLEWSLSP